MDTNLQITLLFLQVLSVYTNLSTEYDLKIVGGREVYPKYKYPYQAYIRLGRYKCGGTVIGLRHVMTAGHCIKGDKPPSRAFVIVGEHTINDRDVFYNSNIQKIFGSNLIRVEKFFKRSYVGIVELERQIEYSHRIGPACIPVKEDGDFAGRLAIVTGWGSTQGYAPGHQADVISSQSPVLMETSLQVKPATSRLCRDIGVGPRQPYLLCAYREGHDTCQGDSGGPMTVRQNGTFVIIGITENGMGCAYKGIAGAYGRVSYFHEWIVEKVKDVCTSKSEAPLNAEITETTVKPRPITSSLSPEYAAINENMTKPRPTPSSVISGCSCTHFVNLNGFGRCMKKDSDFGGSPSCYVALPTSCSDLVRSSTNPSKYLSAEACGGGLPSNSPKPTRPTSTKPFFGCNCTNFMNHNGFGRCRKTSRDFGGRAICYVTLPSSCRDLIRSGSNLGQYLSAEACQTSPTAGLKDLDVLGN